MPRPTLYPAAALVAATVELAAAGGPEAVTIAAVGLRAGAPSGSIYHRFHSRDGLLAAAWLEATRAFQAGFLAALADTGEPPGAAAARHTTNWARHEPAAARVLVLYRAQDFGAGRWGPAHREQAGLLAAELEAGLTAFSRRHLGDSGGEVRRRVTFALLDLPLAGVRRYLSAGIAPPPEVDRYLEETLRALIPRARN